MSAYNMGIVAVESIDSVVSHQGQTDDANSRHERTCTSVRSKYKVYLAEVIDIPDLRNHLD